VARLEEERGLSVLACGAGSAGAVCLGAAKTAGVTANIKILAICFIEKLPGNLISMEAY
jgi:hypothetical protein